MLPSRTRSSASAAGTPRAGKFGRSPSSTKSEAGSHLSNDRSPRSVESSKPNNVLDRRGSDYKLMNLQEQLNFAQEELRKVKARLPLVEKEKANAFEEVNEARKLANDATDKLSEALEALRKAEEDTEIERFRSIELEQAGIEAAQQSEDAWEKEIECVRNQHAMDISALLKTTEELQRLQLQLKMTTEAKNTALMHANDAMKIAEMNAEKVEILIGEVTHFKSLIESSKIESKKNSGQDADVGVVETVELKKLRCEVEKAKEAEKRLIELDTVIEGLKMEVMDAKRRELDATDRVDEWKSKAELLEGKVEETTQSERSTLESLASTVKHLDACTTKLEVNMSEIGVFKEKVQLLGMEIVKHKCDNDELQRGLKMSIERVLDMEKTVQVLKSDIQTLEGEKMEVMENEKKVAAKLQSLVEEKEKIMGELDNCRDEVETSKNALDDLASALKEVSDEARETKERLVTKQNEVANAKDQMVQLNQALKSTEERYMAMLSDARDDTVHLESEIERLEMEAESSKAGWKRKEQSFAGALEKLEEETNALKGQIDVVVAKLKETELEEISAKEENALLLGRIKEVELEGAIASQAMEEAKMESLQLKEILLNQDTRLQSIAEQNHVLRNKEEVALEKIKELSLLLEETTTANDKVEEEDCVDIVSHENGFECEEHKSNPHEEFTQEEQQLKEVVSGHIKEPEEDGEEAEEGGVEVDGKKVKICEMADKEKFLSPEIEPGRKSAEDGSESESENGSLLVENIKNVGSDGSESEIEKDRLPVENIIYGGAAEEGSESKIEKDRLPVENIKNGGDAEDGSESEIEKDRLPVKNIKNGGVAEDGSESKIEKDRLPVENIKNGGAAEDGKESKIDNDNSLPVENIKNGGAAEDGKESKIDNDNSLPVENIKNGAAEDGKESKIDNGNSLPVENIKNGEGSVEDVPEFKIENGSILGENEKNEESVEDGSESKIENDSLSVENIQKGNASPMSKEKQQKKKNVILSRFGSLLKKKNGKK